MVKFKKKIIFINLLTTFFFTAIIFWLVYPGSLSGSGDEKGGKSLAKPAKTTEARGPEGIKYRNIIWGLNGAKHSINVVEADLTHPGVTVAVIKAENYVVGIDRIQNIVDMFEAGGKQKIYGAINANYWRSMSYQPIGPTIHNGEIIYMSTIKTWSSAFFDSRSRMYIDNFRMSGELKSSSGESYQIGNVNIRSKKEGIIVYNRYAGSKIPNVSENQKKAAAKKFKTDRKRAEATLIKKTCELQRVKAVCKYLNSPGINKDIKCIVGRIAKGYIPVPKDGCIISFGEDFDESKIPKTGDKLVIRYNTSANSGVDFKYAVCGSPRIVRNGVAFPETEKERLDNKRFIERKQRRTAIGTNKEKTKIYLVTVAAGKDNSTGATLNELAEIMKYLGCWDAMNLDGGSSTAMVAYDAEKKRIYRIEGTKLSVCLALAKKN